MFYDLGCEQHENNIYTGVCTFRSNHFMGVEKSQ